MNPETLEFVRAFAQFAGGALVGFLISTATTYMNTRTRVLEQVLTEAEKQEIVHRHRRPKSDRVLPYVIVLVMIAMLLAGISWIKSGQDDAENRRRDCLRAAATSEALRLRTENYLESATSEQELWRDLRRELVRVGSDPDSPIVESIERHLGDQRTYLDHLRDNPVPAPARDC